MKVNKKKYHLSIIGLSFIMLLFTICLTMNVFFCGTYNLYELSDKTTVIETQASSERIGSNEGGNNTACFKTSFLNQNNSNYETITKNTRSILMIAAIPSGIRLCLFLVIVFLYFFSALFILLPDRWTLINQKVRLDN